MKRDTDFPVSRKEENSAFAVRREDYALKRDQQAQENNEAIFQRELRDKVKKARCENCGKEFFPEEDSENQTICPECS